MALNIKPFETVDHPDLYLKELSQDVKLSGVDVDEHERETKRRPARNINLIRKTLDKNQLKRSLWFIG